MGSLLDIVYKACESRLAGYMTSMADNIFCYHVCLATYIYIGRQCFKQNFAKTVNF